MLVGRRLIGILRGEIDTLSFLFEGSLMKDFYNGAVYRLSYQKIAAYVDLLIKSRTYVSLKLALGLEA